MAGRRKKEHQAQRRAEIQSRRNNRRATLIRRLLPSQPAPASNRLAPYNRSTCRFLGCRRPARVRHLCHRHDGDLRSIGVLWVDRRIRPFCAEPDCTEPTYAVDRCRSHYAIWNRNNPNSGPITAANTSGYRGVSWNGKRWSANIGVNEKQIYLGSYPDKITAARAYDAAARELHGDHARLNFPDQYDHAPLRQVAKQSAPIPIHQPPPERHRPILVDKTRGHYTVSLWLGDKEIYHAIYVDKYQAINKTKELLRQHPTAVGAPKRAA